MNDLSPQKGASAPAPAPRKGRITHAMRRAIKLRVEEGETIKRAAERAGITEQAWHKAMKRPHVREYLEAESARFIREIDRRRATYRAQAIEVAANLMKNAQSEAVRMRAVEFFAGETRAAPQVQVNVGIGGGGYEYLPPGARVVEIEGSATEIGCGEGPAIHTSDDVEQDQ